MNTATITRRMFAAAIAEGLDSAEGLTAEQRDALLSVARDAKRVGTNYNTGCPAILAGIIPRDYGHTIGATNVAAEDFASGFDGAMARLMREADHPARYSFVDYLRIAD